jgi:hypothetical protein
MEISLYLFFNKFLNIGKKYSFCGKLVGNNKKRAWQAKS